MASLLPAAVREKGLGAPRQGLARRKKTLQVWVWDCVPYAGGTHLKKYSFWSRVMLELAVHYRRCSWLIKRGCEGVISNDSNNDRKSSMRWPQEIHILLKSRTEEENEIKSTMLLP